MQMLVISLGITPLHLYRAIYSKSCTAVLSALGMFHTPSMGISASLAVALLATLLSASFVG